MKTQKNKMGRAGTFAGWPAVLVTAMLFFGCYDGSMTNMAVMTDSCSGFTSTQEVALAEDVVPHNTEEYNVIRENGFKDVKHEPLSTFSIDVDKAAYSNVRRFLNYNQLPPSGAVRIEEMINYFTYDYPQPKGEHPFAVKTELGACPWNSEHRLLHIGIQGKSLDYQNLKASNLVFLVDVSGSMDDNNKLPLVKKSLKMLVKELGEQDRIALVTYAGEAGVALRSTPCSEKDKIIRAIERLGAGGSTAGNAGIRKAYEVAKDNYIAGGNNRVVLATDGDFNVGVSSTDALVELIEEKRKDDIYLTICGYGMGNYKDGRMEQISNAGNGNYFYIDNIKEAQKVFVTEMRANMFTIAKDVKIQIEFNPAHVASYRLIGYEDRLLNKEDFNNDKKDAGELGAGHTVTALYEIIPPGAKSTVNSVDKLKYQEEAKPKTTSLHSKELMVLKLRYKPINSEESKLVESVVYNEPLTMDKTSENLRWSASVAAFGMLLRKSSYIGEFKYADVRSLAQGSKSKDEAGYRDEFVKMVETAQLLAGQ